MGSSPIHFGGEPSGLRKTDLQAERCRPSDCAVAVRGAEPEAPIGVCVPVGRIDPCRPTLILTHGMRYRTRYPATWEPLSDLREIGEAAHERTSVTRPLNILHFVWPKASRHLEAGVRNLPAIVRFCIHAFRETDAEGRTLATSLRELLGQGYREPVHFVGHSYGALVNAHAVCALSLAGWGGEAQFTALDVALHLTLGKDRELLRLLAGNGVGLRVSRLDNYFGPPFFALGTGIRGAGPGRFGGGHRVASTHCGVMNFYRDTVRNPRMHAGFNHSILT